MRPHFGVEGSQRGRDPNSHRSSPFQLLRLEGLAMLFSPKFRNGQAAGAGMDAG